MGIDFNQVTYISDLKQLRPGIDGIIFLFSK